MRDYGVVFEVMVRDCGPHVVLGRALPLRNVRIEVMVQAETQEGAAEEFTRIMQEMATKSISRVNLVRDMISSRASDQVYFGAKRRPAAGAREDLLRGFLRFLADGPRQALVSTRESESLSLEEWRGAVANAYLATLEDPDEPVEGGGL